MKKHLSPIFGAIIMAALLLSACSGSVQAALQPLKQAVAAPTSTAPAVTVQQNASPVQPGLLAAYENTLENVYSQVNPSVVNIRVVESQDVSTIHQGIPGFPSSGTPQTPQFSQALGSGFVWDQNGYIVTNNHVVDGADKVEVTFSDGTAVSAKVVGKDPDTDLAVIRVDVAAGELHPVQLADSTQVMVGQVAIAIGNPFGLQGTMTAGIISAIGRSLPASESNLVGPVYTIPDVLQTDAPINPGNSGGVLVNDQGQVIGVTAAIQSTSGANAGIGFAIPSALVDKVVPALIQSGHVDHPYLGISGTTLTPDLATAMDLKSGQRGALVEEVTSGGPADKAGLRGSDKQVTIDGQEALVGGDVIIAIDGSPVNTMDDLIAYLMDKTIVDQRVSLTVLRGGKETSLEVTLGARPKQAAQEPASTNPNSPLSTAFLGIQATTLTPDVASAMNLSQDQQGILVQQVEAGSPADKAGLRGSYKPATINGQPVLVGGDVITAVDQQALATLDDLRAFLEQARPGQEISLTILRGEETLQVSVTLAARQ